MDLYMIRRRTGWKTPEELQATAQRSKDVAEADFPQDIAWIRSYVISEEDGQLGTLCIYQASSEDAVRQHADKVGMPADEVRPIADTVIVRPDPEPAAAG
jgi:sporulation protein YlmC with PRC-barrel domain